MKCLPEGYNGPDPPAGITWVEEREKWLVRVRDGTLKNVGYFSNINDAIELNNQLRIVLKIRKERARKERIIKRLNRNKNV